MVGRTTIMIAHRLTTIQKANRIIVIQAGRVAEAGTHDVLMQMNGIYANLVQKQVKVGESEREKRAKKLIKKNESDSESE